MLPAEIHPEATRELEESFHWYDDQTPGLALLGSAASASD